MGKKTDIEILSDAKDILKQYNNCIVVANKKKSISENVSIDIVSIVDFKFRISNISMGNHYRVVMAIGGVDKVEYGIPYARLAFLQIWYNEDSQVITHDLLEGYPH